MLESELSFAVETVRSAVRICRQVQAEISPGRWDKHDRTPVTVADLGVQAVVSAALEEQYPHDPLMAEEESRELREPAWNDLLVKVTEHVRLVRPASSGQAAILDWIERGQQPIDSQKRCWVLDPVDGSLDVDAGLLGLVERDEECTPGRVRGQERF